MGWLSPSEICPTPAKENFTRFVLFFYDYALTVEFSSQRNLVYLSSSYSLTIITVIVNLLHSQDRGAKAHHSSVAAAYAIHPSAVDGAHSKHRLSNIMSRFIRRGATHGIVEPTRVERTRELPDLTTTTTTNPVSKT